MRSPVDDQETVNTVSGELVTETFEYDGGRQVTVYVPPGLAPPALVKITLAPPLLICMPLERLMRPALVVLVPVQIVPAQETVRNRTLVPDT